MEYKELAKHLIKFTLNEYDIDVIVKSRKKDIVKRRYMCFSVIKLKYPKLSLESIGVLLGGYDHSTVTHGIKECDWSNRVDKMHRDEYNQLKEFAEMKIKGIKYSPDKIEQYKLIANKLQYELSDLKRSIKNLEKELTNKDYVNSCACKQ